MRARSSGKTGAPFSHLPTGGRAGARTRLYPVIGVLEGKQPQGQVRSLAQEERSLLCSRNVLRIIDDDKEDDNKEDTDSIISSFFN